MPADIERKWRSNVPRSIIRVLESDFRSTFPLCFLSCRESSLDGVSRPVVFDEEISQHGVKLESYNLSHCVFGKYLFPALLGKIIKITPKYQIFYTFAKSK